MQRAPAAWIVRVKVHAPRRQELEELGMAMARRVVSCLAPLLVLGRRVSATVHKLSGLQAITCTQTGSCNKCVRAGAAWTVHPNTSSCMGAYIR